VRSASLKVKLLLDGQSVLGDLTLAEQADAPEDAAFHLELKYETEAVEGSGADYFEALVSLRRKLEARQVLICVNGASKGVWPSAMSRSMSCGLKAYRMKIGHQALTQDLVEVFAFDPEMQPCSIVEQENFKNEWFASLGADT